MFLGAATILAFPAKKDEMAAAQNNIEAGDLLGKSWDCPLTKTWSLFGPILYLFGSILYLFSLRESVLYHFGWGQFSTSGVEPTRTALPWEYPPRGFYVPDVPSLTSIGKSALWGTHLPVTGCLIVLT